MNVSKSFLAAASLAVAALAGTVAGSVLVVWAGFYWLVERTFL